MRLLRRIAVELRELLRLIARNVTIGFLLASIFGVLFWGWLWWYVG